MASPFTLCAFGDEADDALDGQIAVLNGNGIGWLELRGVDGVNVSNLDAAGARRIRAALDAAGIRVWSLGSPTGKIRLSDDFAPHLDAFRRMLELADILGAARLRLFSFYGEDNGAPPDRDGVMERLSRLAEAADGSGLVLCHENEKGIYGETAEACLDIHRSVPALRAVFDPANFVQAGQDTLAAWDRLEPYVEYMHIKDALPGGRVVPAGRGAGYISALLDRFAAAGGGVLSLEPHLAVFRGLDALERGHESAVDPFAFAAQREAFDAACGALKALI